ncbi:MAG TPA: proton-conducting transporter membrane subunit [Nitrosomonas mobilis]|nr:proton-conducting transporter membrane subunit [Nitrosomonas mobilis]
MDLMFASLLQYMVYLPLVGFTLSLFMPASRERPIAWLSIATAGIYLVCAILLIAYWLFLWDFHSYQFTVLTLYESHDYRFDISFYFDKVTAIFLFLGAFLSFLVTIYCQNYLHRDSGYKRFFNALLLFYVSYNIVIFAGNLETLFLGWEILGICSFLLVGFYRERFLPVKNALKIFTVFRIADMGLLFAIWLNHHLWHRNITFSELLDSEMVWAQLQEHTTIGIMISLMILLAAAVKSAQIPFTAWIPRAMEAPTPSSAIFYGSLASHLGVFLLLRTYPFWEHLPFIVALVALIGLATSIVATLISYVQSSIKTQIAYSSAAQIGLIFIEVAFGLYDLALIHLTGNAFLRTYQILVAPSVVTYLIREQFFKFVPHQHVGKYGAIGKLKYALYILAVKEFYLDSFVYVVLWNPMKWVGRKLDGISENSAFSFIITSSSIGVICILGREYLPSVLTTAILPTFFAFVGLLMVLRSFTERKNAQFSWMLIVVYHLWVALAVTFYEEANFIELAIYLGGILLSGFVGNATLNQMRIREGRLDWNDYQGHVYQYPGLALIFFLSCLGLMLFPITPSFLGVDLVFTYIRVEQTDFAIILALSYILVGLSLVRMYARIFLGPHIKTNHEIPPRSS